MENKISKPLSITKTKFCKARCILLLFSSIIFLYYFLPIVIVLYFLVPRKLKNLVVVVAVVVSVLPPQATMEMSIVSASISAAIFFIVKISLNFLN